MKHHYLHAPRQLAAGSLLLVAALLAAALGPGLPVFSAPLQVTVPSTLGFEGYLADANGDPVADGDYDLAFKLWNAASGGSQVGSTETHTDVAVSGGLYTVELTTFTASSFDGSRWLGITATGGPTTVNDDEEIVPRTRITSVPFALNAQTANSADAVAWSAITGRPSGLDNGDDNTTYSAGTGLDLTATTFSVASSFRLPQGCTNNYIAKWNGSAWTCQADSGVTGSGSNGQLALWGASGLTSNAGLTYSSNNLSATGGLNLGSASGAGAGDLAYSGSLKSYKNSTTYTAYAYVPLSSPLTSTSWDGDAFSDTSATQLDLNAVFGLPANVKAVSIRMFGRDSAAWGTNNLFFAVGPSNTYVAACVLRNYGGDIFTETSGAVCPTDGQSRVYYQIDASGAGTFDLWLQITGYFL